MKCDQIRTRQQGDTPFFPNMLNNGNVEVCLKEDVDEAIAELKTENLSLKAKNIELQSFYDLHGNVDNYIDKLKAENKLLKEHIANGDVSRITWIDEVIELKKKLESVQASMYCDVVDANMENRRLKRALWLARAYRAEARKNYWYVRSIHEGDKYMWSIDGSAVKYIGCIKRSNFDWLKVWSEVERKCRAKAEEYK